MPLQAPSHERDTILLKDNEWRTAGDHHQVLYSGKWHDVPPWALTASEENITGKAVM
jgi:hypothetical protein